MTDTLPGGELRLADDLTLTRMGYGAMQLAGPRVMGPPSDPDEAAQVLRTAVELGITHIDTALFYGPDVVNELIRDVLSPYPDHLHIVTKVGAERDAEGNWPQARTPEQLRDQVHRNLRSLGVEALDLVNLRWGGAGDHGSYAQPGSLADEFGALADLQRAGDIRHLGLSAVDTEQLAEAQRIAPVVAVQNLYNIAQRHDDDLLERTAEQGIAFVPFFPLGGFSPVQSDRLSTVAHRLGVTPMALALSWLLARSPNVLLIPGTSSVAHLRENVAAASVELDAETVAELDAIGDGAQTSSNASPGTSRADRSG